MRGSHLVNDAAVATSCSQHADCYADQRKAADDCRGTLNNASTIHYDTYGIPLVCLRMYTLVTGHTSHCCFVLMNVDVCPTDSCIRNKLYLQIASN